MILNLESAEDIWAVCVNIMQHSFIFNTNVNSFQIKYNKDSPDPSDTFIPIPVFLMSYTELSC